MSLQLGEDVPWLARRPASYVSSFDVNITAFVKSHGRPVKLQGLPDVLCWTISLVGKRERLQLQIYKEKNGENGSELCDQCRIIGWQNHPVCHHRWHIIVPLVEDMYVSAVSTQQLLAFPVEAAAAYYTPPTAFDSHAHLLHGFIHPNGFGHLARVNGREGGSSKLTGKQLMAVWDNLCRLLRARQISVEDVSNKGGMELRVLHAAAYKSTWYGKWGYQYGRGAFNISHNKWKKAIEAVHRAKLALMLADFAGVHSAVPAIVARYKAVEKECNTLGALLQRMLGLLSKPQEAADLFAKERMSSAMAVTSLPAPANGQSQPVQQGVHVEQQGKVESHFLPSTAAVTASAMLSAPQLPLVPPLMTGNTAVTATPAPHSFATQIAHACSTSEPALAVQPVSYMPPLSSEQSAKVQPPVVVHHCLPSSMAASLGSQPQAKQENSHNSPLHPGLDASHTASSTLQHAVSGIPQLQLSGPATAAVASVTAGQQSRARGKPSNHTTALVPREVKKPRLLMSRAGRMTPPPMPAGRMPYNMIGIKEVDLSNAPKRWSTERCRASLAKVMGALMAFEGWWVARTTARQEIQKYMGDTGMMDYMLKAVANHSVGPYIVFRQTDPDDSDRNLFYLVLKKDGSTELPALGAVFMPPQQHDGLPDEPSDSLPSAVSSAEQRQSIGSTAQQQPHTTLHAPSTNLPMAAQQPLTVSALNVASVPAAPAAHVPAALLPAALTHATTAPLAPQSMAEPPAAELPVQVAQHSLTAGPASSSHRLAAGLASYPAQDLQHAQQDNMPEAEEGDGRVVCDPDHMLDSHLQEVLQAPTCGHMPQQSLGSEHRLPAGSSSQLVSNPPVHAAHSAPQPAVLRHSEQRSHDHKELPHVPPRSTEVKQDIGSSAHHTQQPVGRTQLEEVLHTDAAAQSPVDSGSPQHAVTVPVVSHPQQAFLSADAPDHSHHPVEQLTSTKRLMATSKIPVTHQVGPSSAPPPVPAALCATPSASASPLMLPSPDLAEVAVVPPRQGELKGVLALACTQIIARQQARSPNTFMHRQQPSQVLSAFQSSTSTTPGQHSPQGSTLETGYPEPKLVTEQPQSDPHTRQQAVHNAHEQRHTSQEGVHSRDLLAMPSTGPQPQHILPQHPILPPQVPQTEPAQLLEDEWTSMLIDQPDTGQAEATQQVSSCPHPAAVPPQSLVVEQRDQVQPTLLHGQLHTAQQLHSDLQVSDVEATDHVQGVCTAVPGKPAIAAGPELLPSATASDGNVLVTAESRLGDSFGCGCVPAANQLVCDVSNLDSSSAMEPPTLGHDGQQHMPKGVELSITAAPEPGVQVEHQAWQLQPPTVDPGLSTSTCLVQAISADQHDQQTSESVPAVMISASHLEPSQAGQCASHAAAPQPQPYSELSAAPQAEVSTLDSTGPTLPAAPPHTRSNSLHSTLHPFHAILQEPAGSVEHAQQPATASDSELEHLSHCKAIELPAGQAEHAESLLQPHSPTLTRCTRSAHHLQEAVSVDASEPKALAEQPEHGQATFKQSGAEQHAGQPQETEAADEQINAQQCNGEPEVMQLQTAASDAAPATKFNAQSTSSLSAQSSKPSQQETEAPKQLQMPTAAAMSQPLSQLDSSAPSPPHPAVISNRGDAAEPQPPRPHLRRSSRGPASILADAAAPVVSAAPKPKQPAKHTLSPSPNQKHARHAPPAAAATISTTHKKQTRKQQQLTQQCASLPHSPRATRNSNSNSRVQNGKRKHPELSDAGEGEDSQPLTSAVKLVNSLAGKKRKSGSSRSSGQTQTHTDEAVPAQPSVRRTRHSPLTVAETQQHAVSPPEPTSRPKRTSKQNTASLTPPVELIAHSSSLASGAAVESIAPGSKTGNKQKADKLKAAGRPNDVKARAKKKAKLVMADSPQWPAEQKTQDAADRDAASGGAKLPETVVKIEVPALGKQANGQHGSTSQAGDQQNAKECQDSPVMPSRLRRKVAVDYNEGSKRKGTAASAHPLTMRRRAAPDIALASSRPPPVLIPQPWHTLQPGAPFTPAAGFDPRDQVLCDLVYLFNNTLRTYAPAEGHHILLQLPTMLPPHARPPAATSMPPTCNVGTSSAMPAPQSSEMAQRIGKLKLKQLAQDAQTLRDVKHFVKDYQGHLALPLPHLTADGLPVSSNAGHVRLLLQVQLPDKDALPARLPHKLDAFMPAANRVSSPEQQAAVAARPPSLPPPVHPLLVPQRASMAQVRKSAEAAMADVYTMLQDWQVTGLTGLESSELRNKVGTSIADNTIVYLSGTNIDPTPALRIAGGFEDWTVSCRCGTHVDDGERMVACDVCGVWMHTRCHGMPDAHPIPDEFVCYQCTTAASRKASS